MTAWQEGHTGHSPYPSKGSQSLPRTQGRALDCGHVHIVVDEVVILEPHLLEVDTKVNEVGEAADNDLLCDVQICKFKDGERRRSNELISIY